MQTDDEKIDEEATNLERLWNAYAENDTRSDNPEPLHPAPALSITIQAILAIDGNPLILPIRELEGFILEGGGREALEDSLPIVSRLLVGALLFGNRMFLYGQYCSKNGLLAANMTQCKCEQHTVEKALEQILKDSQ